MTAPALNHDKSIIDAKASIASAIHANEDQLTRRWWGTPYLLDHCCTLPDKEQDYGFIQHPVFGNSFYFSVSMPYSLATHVFIIADRRDTISWGIYCGSDLYFKKPLLIQE